MTVLKYVWRVFVVLSLGYWAFLSTTLLWPLSGIASFITGWTFFLASLEIFKQWMEKEA